MACTSPRRTRRSMSRLATTPGKRLVMPRSSTAYGSPEWGTSLVLIAPLYSIPDANGGWERSKPARPASVIEPGRTRSGQHRDLAGLDLVGELLDLCLDVVDESAGGGQDDAVGLQVVDDVRVTNDLAVIEVVDVGVDRVVDPLERRGHDHRLQRGVADRLVLVGVDADGTAVGGLGRLEDAEAGAAGRRVDDVGALVVHALGDDLALRRVVEPGEVAGGRDVLDVDGDVRLHGLGAGHVAGLELLDQRGLLTADEADVVGRRLQGGGDTGQEGALVLREPQSGDVSGAERLAVGVQSAGVDDRELGVRVLLGHVADHVAVGEAHRDDRVVALICELGEQVGTVGGVGVRRELGVLAAVVLDRLLDAREGGVVERLVTATAGVVSDADLQVATAAAAAPAAAAAAVLLVAGTGRQRHAAGEQQHGGLRHPRSAQDDLLSGRARAAVGRSAPRTSGSRATARPAATAPGATRRRGTLAACGAAQKAPR